MHKENVTIHIIDDDPAVRDSLHWLLGPEDYQVKTYADAPSFLNHLPEQNIGCIVTDIRMPQMSGLELYNALAETTCTLPVIMITGHGDVAMAVKALKDGVYDFIEKPFDNTLLLDKIKQAAHYSLTQHEELLTRKVIESRFESLTSREKEIMDKIVLGMANKDIAADLDISIKTVEVHRSRVMDKMQASSLASLVRMSMNL